MVRGRPEGLNRTEKDLLTSILAASVKSRDDETWGYELQRTFKDLFSRSLSWGTMFPALRRLEAAGLLSSRWEQPDRGPRRRLYRLTEEGRRVSGAVQAEARRAKVPTVARKRTAHA